MHGKHKRSLNFFFILTGLISLLSTLPVSCFHTLGTHISSLFMPLSLNYFRTGNYGEKGFEQLQKLLEGSIVCIAHNEKIKPLATEEEYDKVRENGKMGMIID